MSPSGVQVNKTFLLSLVGMFAGVFVVYRFWNSTSEKEGSSAGDKMADSAVTTWYKGDEMEVVPAELANTGQVVKEATVNVVLGDKTLKIFTRRAEARNPKLDILLLHGAKFSSKEWLEIGTLQFLANCGYRAVAIDLPGYGNSKNQSTDSKGEFVAAIVKTLQLDRPVVVSPSMSGSFSLPFLFDEPIRAQDRSRGYVPVAPTMTDKYLEAYKQSKIATMIVYGENDSTLGQTSLKYLKNLPNSKDFVIVKAGHAAYLDDTKYFHKLLYNFLKVLSS